jgi:formylglycine-generating enzyme required for sulfatase activity
MQRSLVFAQAKIEEMEKVPSSSLDPKEKRRLERFIELLALREEQIADLEEELEVRRIWHFADPASKWQHDQLTDLVFRLDRLGDENAGLLTQVKTRLEMALTIEEESIDKHIAEWERALAAIADRETCPMYKGLEITPQMGMVPLGPDPASGLWEFVHLQTGKIPQRRSDGTLEITEETGLVLVLIPGGTFEMGAEPPTEARPPESPNVDPEASEDQGPVHTVTLGPFLLSKYEMTQGQWLRFTGANPSYYHPAIEPDGTSITLVHPVESVSWEDCRRELFRMKLRLPTEAEWEYAARAGTSTIWWTGNDIRSLQGKGNFYDQGDRELVPGEVCIFNDPYPFHAPVGVFVPNAFGLHNVLGNVSEWCQDSYGSYRDTPRDGSAYELSSVEMRISRGNAWTLRARHDGRSAYRKFHSLGLLYQGLGVRPAASLQQGSAIR